MPLRSLSHLSDAELDRDIKLVHRREQHALGEGLSHIAEFDTRKRYLSAGYESMYLYCLAELHLSENQTLKRLQVVRAGRMCPALFDAIADGHLHLTGAGLLAPHLTAENSEEWLRLARHRTKREIDALLAEHFRQPKLPVCEPEPELASPIAEHAPAQVREAAPAAVEVQQDETRHAPAHGEHMPGDAGGAPIAEAHSSPSAGSMSRPRRRREGRDSHGRRERPEREGASDRKSDANVRRGRLMLPALGRPRTGE